MFSFLKSIKSSNKESGFKSSKHAVLGTFLSAPIATDEEEILFGCGCFWGAEKGFWKLPGVISTSVGYAGGEKSNPSYQEVCTGNTGHTEVVRVVWKKSSVDLSDLLKLFWECHSPTQGNRQGNDKGTQYRSAIYAFKEKHIELAFNSRESYQEALIKNGYGDITTEIGINKKYYFAENYHQQYLAKPGARPYCSAMPTNVILEDFKKSNFILDKEIWVNYDWSKNHCILNSSNEAITL